MGDSRAICIGVSTYSVADSYLPGPSNGAVAMAVALSSIEGSLFSPFDVEVLADPTMARASTALSDFLRPTSQPPTRLVVYLACHASRTVDLHDAHLCFSDTVWTDRVPTPSITIRDLLARCDHTLAREVLVILDCCHSGAALNLLDPERGAGRNRFVYASCAESMMAPSAKRDDVSIAVLTPFTAALVAAMHGIRETVSGDLDLPSLDSFVRNELLTHTMAFRTAEAYREPQMRATPGSTATFPLAKVIRRAPEPAAVAVDPVVDQAFVGPDQEVEPAPTSVVTIDQLTDAWSSRLLRVLPWTAPALLEDRSGTACLYQARIAREYASRLAPEKQDLSIARFDELRQSGRTFDGEWRDVGGQVSDLPVGRTPFVHASDWRTHPCPKCGGSQRVAGCPDCADGTVPGTRSTTCDRCQGSGERITRRTEDCRQCAMGHRSDLFATSADATPCKACDDTGSVDIVDRRSCPACKGLGERHVSNPHSCQTCKGEATRPCDLCGATGRTVLATVAQIERWPPEGETVQAVTADDAPASLSTSWKRVRLGSSSVRVRGDDVSTSTGSQAERKLVALGEDVTSFVDANGRTEIGRSIELKQLLITWVLYSTANGRTRAAVVLGRHHRVVLIDAVHRVRLGLLALLVVAIIVLAVAGFVSLR
jgi:hypothetical protein